MTIINMKKNRADLVNEMGIIDHWLSDFVGHLKKCKTEKDISLIYDEKSSKVKRKIQIQTEIRRINIQIQEQNESEKEEMKKKEIDESEIGISDNEYLRLILEELRKIVEVCNDNNKHEKK